MSMSLALSICVLFILLMQLVYKVNFLIIIFFLLFTAAATMFGTVIVAPTGIYASL